MREKRSSLATSHRTGTRLGGMPPSSVSGDVASRVQITTPSGVGSPDATPSVNGVDANVGAALTGKSKAGTTSAPVDSSRNVRREIAIIPLV
jgi:hypothetical protein